MPGVARGTAVVSAFNIGGMLLRIVTISAIAKYFGTGADLDAYFVGITIPNIIAGMVSTAFAATVVPILSDAESSSETRNVRAITGSLVQWSVLFAVLCFAVLFFASAPIVHLMAPGLSIVEVDRGVSIFRISAAGLILVFPLEVLRSYFLLKRQFTMTSITLCTQPAVLLIGTVLFADVLGTVGLALFQVVGIVVGLAILLVAFLREGGPASLFRFEADRSVAHVGRLAMPLLVGMLAYRFLPTFDRWIASQMGIGQISVASYAQRLLETIQVFLLSGISTAIFPTLSQSVSSGNLAAANRMFAKAIRVSLFLYIPAGVALVCFGKVLVSLLLERGRFTGGEGVVTLTLLHIYLLAMPSLAVCAVMGQGYYVKKDTITVALIGLLETAVYVTIALALRHRVGINCLPWAFVGMSWFALAINGMVLGKKHHFRLFRPAFYGFWTSATASVLAICPWLVVSAITDNASSVIGSFFFLSVFICVYVYIRWRVLPSEEIGWFKAVGNAVLSKVVPGRAFDV
jgi:putative peptidoglycan lipid II flippase